MPQNERELTEAETAKRTDERERFDSRPRGLLRKEPERRPGAYDIRKSDIPFFGRNRRSWFFK